MFLLDQDSDELVATVFDGITTNNKEVMLPSLCRVSLLHQFLSPSVAHHMLWSVWVHCMCMQYSVWYASCNLPVDKLCYKLVQSSSLSRECIHTVVLFFFWFKHFFFTYFSGWELSSKICFGQGLLVSCTTAEELVERCTCVEPPVLQDCLR